jgi:AraC-like DNA-binding protein
LDKTYKELIQESAAMLTDQVETRSSMNKLRFDKLIEWIDARIDGHITLNDLLRESGMSLHELTIQFHFNTGLAPLAYVSELKKLKRKSAFQFLSRSDNYLAHRN